MAFTKKEIEGQKIKKIILISYIILSGLFILFSLFHNLKISVYNIGVQQGTENAIAQVIAEAKKECRAVNLYMGEEKIDIINLDCVQQNPSEENPL